MKTVITILLGAILFASCETKPQSEYDTLNEFMTGGEMIRVRGCEYIKSHVYLGSVYTHAGDCNNPIHKK